jgi:hypothetical protein
METVKNSSNVEYRIQYTVLQGLASFKTKCSELDVKPTANTSIMTWEAGSLNKDVDLLTIAVREEAQASASQQFQIVGNSAILEGNVSSNATGAYYSSEEPLLRADLEDIRLYATREQSRQCTGQQKCGASSGSTGTSSLRVTYSIVISIVSGCLASLIVGTCCFMARRRATRNSSTLVGPGGGGGCGGGSGGD